MSQKGDDSGERHTLRGFALAAPAPRPASAPGGARAPSSPPPAEPAAKPVPNPAASLAPSPAPVPARATTRLPQPPASDWGPGPAGMGEPRFTQGPRGHGPGPGPRPPASQPAPPSGAPAGDGPIRVVCRQCRRTVWGWKLPFGVSCPLGPHHSHINWFLVAVVASFWAAFIVVVLSLFAIAA